jgi:phage terminase large subunit
MSVAVVHRIKAPELRGASFALGACRDREVCLDGPAGTGKTVGALYKIHRLLCLYPGTRALVARKTNTALSGSAMITYRDNIRRERTDIRWFGGNKVEPAAFKYSNGSEMIVNGLDKPEKVQSAEFDWAYINEATECDLEDIEFVRMRLRPRTNTLAVPYRQLIMDCNPSAPTHWLNQRMNEGMTKRLISRHEDNPRYFDLRTNDWTEEGREYVFGILGGLTGVRLARYRYGIWAAAEGTVYEQDWDRSRNVIDNITIPKAWPRYLSIDFGYTNPFVCAWWAVDPDGRLYRYREIYKTKTLVEDHARAIAIASGWHHLLPRDHPRYNVRPAENADPLPREIIADHDAEDRATLERHLGLNTTPAKKTVRDGIQSVAARLRPAGDGKPRLFFLRDARIDRDPELARRKLPTCTEEEMETYTWRTDAKGEEPVKENDHGNDQTRYIAAHLDLQQSSVSYYKNIWG